MRLAVAAAIAALAVAPAAAAQLVPPPWLAKAERRLLDRAFGGATPIRTTAIAYPSKIAVVFEFDRVVVCGLCSSPSAAMQPRGRVIRVSFDRRTHDLGGAKDGWAMRFCEARGGRPPKSACLRR